MERQSRLNPEFPPPNGEAAMFEVCWITVEPFRIVFRSFRIVFGYVSILGSFQIPVGSFWHDSSPFFKFQISLDQGREALKLQFPTTGVQPRQAEQSCGHAATRVAPPHCVVCGYAGSEMRANARNFAVFGSKCAKFCSFRKQMRKMSRSRQTREMSEPCRSILPTHARK